VVAALVTGAAAVADLAGWDPAGAGFAGGRVGGLLGQPAYLAALAVLLAPVAAAVATDPATDRGWRAAGAAGAAACGIALVASGTRGAWVAALVAAVVAWPRLRGRVVAVRRVAAGGADDRSTGGGEAWPRLAASEAGCGRGGAGVAVDGAGSAVGGGAGSGVSGAAGPALGAGAVAARAASVGRWGVRVAGVGAAGVALVVVAAPVGARVVAAGDRGEGGGIGRVDEWGVALAVVAEHPLTGVGPEGYRVAAPRHIGDGYARRHGRSVVVDRAHDGPLDVAVTAGLPAAACYVALLGGLVWRAGSSIRRGRQPVVVGAAVGVLAWVVQQVVSFPLAEVDPAAWLLAGVVVAGGPGPGRVRVAELQRVVAGALAGALAVLGATAVVADRRIERATRTGDPVAATAVADSATALRPDDVDAWYVAARVAASGPSLLAVDAGIDRVDGGLRRAPLDPALLGLREELLAERAVRSGLAADREAAIAASRALVAADPAGPAHHRLLGMVLAAGGDTAGARAELRRALDLDPGDDAARRALAALDPPAEEIR
jgi:hypothetical protein